MVASVTTIGMVGLARGYVAPVRTPTRERDEEKPDDALGPQGRADLAWFFNSCEAAMGVKSTFGAQCERAAQAMPTESAVLDARRYQRERVREWVALGHDANEPGSPRFDIETMPVHETAPYATQDPYESDDILGDVAKARRIRAALNRCDRSSVLVLYAAFGPPKGNEAQRRTMAKKFGNLVEIVVAINAFMRSESDPSARDIVDARISDDSFVRLMVKRAQGMLRVAARDYAGCA